MSQLIRKRDKWHFLRLSAQWDRSIVPIYEAAARGKCVPLLKTLLTNHCKNECAYCAFRTGRKCQRIVWQPKKLAEVTMHLWRKRKISGLFLSSSISREPDYVMENQLEVLRILRSMGYSGYIHLRLMPGMSRHYVREAVELADRIGVNLEAPNKVIFDEICPDKGGFNEAVLKRLTWIIDEVNRVRHKTKESRSGFGKSGVDTQIIVGATDDNDWQYMQVTEWLYKKHGLTRVNYSGFEPVTQTPLEKRTACPSFREYRLYQCSFLIRDYGFRTDDLAQIVDDEGFLPNVDPKLKFVKANQDFFPVDLNSATYSEIVRIPHIGPSTAKRIIEARKETNIQYSTNLEKIVGANMTRRVGRYIELKDKKLTDLPNEDT